jgi:hypothetical protein
VQNPLSCQDILSNGLTGLLLGHVCCDVFVFCTQSHGERVYQAPDQRTTEVTKGTPNQAISSLLSFPVAAQVHAKVGTCLSAKSSFEYGDAVQRNSAQPELSWQIRMNNSTFLSVLTAYSVLLPEELPFYLVMRGRASDETASFALDWCHTFDLCHFHGPTV